MNRTKIIASISDLCDEKRLLGIATAGANILRMNFSHATHEGAGRVFDMIHKLNAKGKFNLSIMLDTKGPEIRTGDVKEKVLVKKGQTLKIFVKKNLIKSDIDLYCDYPYLVKDVKKGQIIIIDSGLLKAKVVSKTKDYVVVKSLNTHLVGSRRHINLPGVKLTLPGLTKRDKEDIAFGIKNGINFVAASFIRNKSNIAEIRAFLKKHNAEHIGIISKIENQEAIENLEDIVANSDAIMVARGDLGVELSIEKLPFYQKQIMDMCFLYGKTIIIATELLKSMVHSPFPTRAEVSDVYNSVILRTDCVMLSEETAIGSYPNEAVATMKEIIEEAEKHTKNKHKDFFMKEKDPIAKVKKTIVKHALEIADETNAKYIILFTNSGALATIVQNYKPNVPVFAFSKDEKIIKKMNILFGISPVKFSKLAKNYEENKDYAISFLKKEEIIKKGDKIVVIGDSKNKGQIEPHIKIVIS